MTYTQAGPQGRMIIRTAAQGISSHWLGRITIMRIELRQGRIMRESYPVHPAQASETEALALAGMAAGAFLEAEHLD